MNNDADTQHFINLSKGKASTHLNWLTGDTAEHVHLHTGKFCVTNVVQQRELQPINGCINRIVASTNLLTSKAEVQNWKLEGLLNPKECFLCRSENENVEGA